jgi:cytochrome c peroxidase
MKIGNALVLLVPLALGSALSLFGCSGGAGEQGLAQGDDALSDQSKPKPTKASLGALIFADTNLSEPPGQACATCHVASSAFADPRPGPTSAGAVAGRFGFRNTPSITYSSFTPKLGPAGPGENGGFLGGLFWDGRAATLQAQASGPLLNKLEMNNPDTATIQGKLKAASYASQIRTLYGKTALDTADKAMSALTDAIAAFETTGMPNRFTSKYDAYLAGTATLTAAEARGLALFESEKTGPCTNGAPPCGCAQCHLDKPGADGSPPLFTDFGYDNIGIPKNPDNPYYTLPPDLNPDGANFNDFALGWQIHNPKQWGHFKAPSIRNVALTAPYGHNGYFADLKAIVHFYNTRDLPGAYPPPESDFFLNTTGLGNLGLTSSDEDDLVTFFGTLTDGFRNN